MDPIISLKGIASNRVVSYNNRVLDPTESQTFKNHSPDGFNWGYNGSGSAQLALAVMLRFLKARPEHKNIGQYKIQNLYQRFKFDVIAKLPQGENFEIVIDMGQFIKGD